MPPLIHRHPDSVLDSAFGDASRLATMPPAVSVSM